MKRLFYIAVLLGLVFTACKGGKDTVSAKESRLNTPFRNTFHDALTLKMIGRYDTAAVLFEECLIMDPTSHACHAALSDIYEGFGENDKAFEHAEAAYNLWPENPFYVKRVAQLYYNRGEYTKSVEFFEKVIEEEKNVKVKFTFTDALIKSRNYKRSIEMIDELEVELGQSPQFALTKRDLYIEIGEPEKGEAELQKLLDDNPTNIDYYYAVADYYLSTKQGDKAMDLVPAMAAMKPTSGIPFIVSADVHLRDENFDQAFNDLDSAFIAGDVPEENRYQFLRKLMQFAFLPGNPNAEVLQNGLDGLYTTIDSTDETNPEILALESEYYLETGNAEKAAVVLKKVVDASPDHYENWQSLVMLEFDSWQFEECAQTAENAIDYFPSQPFFYLMKGYAEIENGNLEKAQEYVFLGRDLVVKNKELTAEFEVVMGMILKEKGEFTKAIEYYNKAKKTDPTSAWPYIEEANALVAQNQHSAAYSVLDKALSEFPNNPNILDAYGTIYFDQEKYEEALIKFEAALVNKNYPAVILEHYGDALFLTGKERDANDIWKESRKQGNYSPVLKRKIEDKKYYAE